MTGWSHHGRLLTSRLAFQTLPTLFLVSVLVFALVRLSPLDASSVLAGRGASAADVAHLRERLGLDQPALEQYVTWLRNAAQGDLGMSLFFGDSVMNLIANSVGPTIALVAGALLLASLFGVGLGVAAALRPQSALDRAISAGTSFGVALPEFVLGLVFVTLFAVELHWLPAVGYVAPGESFSGWASHLLLAWVALAAAPAAEITRQTRGAVRDVLNEDYVLSARAKGLPTRTVIGKHVLKNAASTIVTVIGLWAGRMIGSAVFIEYVFAIPGFGMLTVQAVQRHDYPLIQGVVLVSALAVLLINLTVDVAESYLNPRARTSR